EDRSAATVIMTLLATDSSSLPPRYSTNIPPDTTLLDSFVDDQVLTLDLSEQFTTVVGQRFIAAVAQIVYTATDLDGIEAVSFRVEGEDFPVNDENGAAVDEPVDRFDFVGLAPS
ncbi:MAG: GerMN domain-containing protein, partial [Acidimicrobiales bacterium]